MQAVSGTITTDRRTRKLERLLLQRLRHWKSQCTDGASLGPLSLFVTTLHSDIGILFLATHIERSTIGKREPEPGPIRSPISTGGATGRQRAAPPKQCSSSLRASHSSKYQKVACRQKLLATRSVNQFDTRDHQLRFAPHRSRRLFRWYKTSHINLPPPPAGLSPI